jgi:hypothetical protein
MNIWRRRGFLLSLVSALTLLSLSSGASASVFQSQSSSYGVNEAYFGSGGSLSECDTSGYCAKTSTGELAVGPSSSTNFQVHAGFNTTDTPTLNFIVNGGPIDLGILNSSLVHYGSTTFSVLDYVSSGYSVILTGTPPASTGLAPHTLTAMTTAGASSAGTEQFGINLAANSNICGTGCGNVGTGPQQVPDSTFGFGAAQSPYATSNQFAYITTSPNNVVASSVKASGQTLYTLSAIANISNATAAGAYSGQIGLVVVATF